MAKPILSYLACIFFVLYGTGYASNDFSSEKIYITSDQIVFSDYGIFVLLENDDGNLSKIPVTQINWDTNGLFIAKEYLPNPQAAWCRNGHKACSYCFRCDESWCPSYGCRCKR